MEIEVWDMHWRKGECRVARQQDSLSGIGQLQLQPAHTGRRCRVQAGSYSNVDHIALGACCCRSICPCRRCSLSGSGTY